jgi:ABC-2 type transport system ATP-binding protein
MSGAAVLAEGLGVRFLSDRQRRPVTPGMAALRRRGAETWGLRGLDLRIEPGESVALVGATGSGKTSLLRAIAGVYSADEGRITTRGQVAPLLSVEAGLLSALTGRENASLLGVLAGLRRKAAQERLDQVRGASGLGGSFERVVGGYSQGMRARLGFAAADQPASRVLLLDEVHEALDHEFRATLEQRAREMRADGGVVVAAGHDHELLERLCDRAVELQAGRVLADGSFDAVLGGYLSRR